MTVVDLKIIGCSGSVPGPDSPASSYLVQAPHQGRRFSLLLDLGPGAFGALQRHLDPREVDAVGLSHLHPDHCLDLCAYYVAARHSPSAPWPRRPLYGPRGTAERLTRAYEVTADPGSDSIAGHLDLHDWQPRQQIGPFLVETVPVAHPVEAYAIRVTERATGGSLVYSGDSGPCDALTDLARGADLLLVEAGFGVSPDPPPDVHLTGPQAAAIGQRAGVGAVLLTHVPPWYDRDEVLAAARPHFAGPVSLARSGASWTVGAT